VPAVLITETEAIGTSIQNRGSEDTSVEISKKPEAGRGRSLEGNIYTCRSDNEGEGNTSETSVRDETKKRGGRDRLNHCSRQNSEEMVGHSDSTGLRCMYTNACSLPCKMAEIRNLVYTDNFDIIAITDETWANEEITDADLALDGYVLFRNDRQNGDYTKGGGVALYIKDTFQSRVCYKLTNNIFEDSIWCYINFQDL